MASQLKILLESANTNSFNDSHIDQVIYAWNYLSWGGAQIYFLGLIKEARKHFQVRVLLPEGTDEQLQKFLRDEDIEYDFFGPAYVLPTGPGLISNLRMHKSKIQSEIALLKALRNNYELERSIVHVELAPWQSLLALAWLCMRTRVFVTMHNSLPKVNVIRRALWKVKLKVISQFRDFHLFASNVDAKLFFKGLYTGDLFERILVTYTNVNPDEIADASGAEINAGAIRSRHRLRKDTFLVLAVGQFIDRKGRWTFLEAAKKLVSSGEDLDFGWVSNSPLSQSDAARIEAFRLEDRFVLIDSDEVGPDHADLFKLVRTADVFVLPSFVEGLPISLLEAMALGVPCISTNINAIPEAVIHGKTGCLIEAGDAGALAETLLGLKRDPELRARLAQAGSAYVLKKFNEKEVAKIALARYLEVAKR